MSNKSLPRKCGSKDAHNKKDGQRLADRPFWDPVYARIFFNTIVLVLVTSSNVDITPSVPIPEYL